MEKLDSIFDTTITQTARVAIANEYDCQAAELEVAPVSGGYSRNRRALINVRGEWIFAKEVDHDVLPGDGAEELAWLRKDYDCTVALRASVPELVSHDSKLIADDHVLLLSSYRMEDGWMWAVPETLELRHEYIQAVIDATKRLESLAFDSSQVESLTLAPFFRDELALDNGLELILENEAIRHQLSEKYVQVVQDEVLPPAVRAAVVDLQSTLNNPDALRTLGRRAKDLKLQENACFGHCDVRSDNLTYNPGTGEVKFVDWNWASMTPKKFGSTEFLIDMARRGIDVSPWVDELNPELLAASVGFFAKRCLKDPLSPGSTLRDMQALSAAVALNLYDMTCRSR